MQWEIVPELNLNPTPADLILILTQKDYVALESCISLVLKMRIIMILCVTEVPEIYAFLRHRVAKKIETILAPGEALQWQYFYKFKVLHTENKTNANTLFIHWKPCMTFKIGTILCG